MTQDQDTLDSYSDGAMPDHVDLDAAEYVTASKYRTAVLRELAGGEAVPSDINDDVEFRFKSVSRALTELRDRGLIELLVPEERTHGRRYRLTERGENGAPYPARNPPTDQVNLHEFLSQSES